MTFHNDYRGGYLFISEHADDFCLIEDCGHCTVLIAESQDRAEIETLQQELTKS